MLPISSRKSADPLEHGQFARGYTFKKKKKQKKTPSPSSYHWPNFPLHTGILPDLTAEFLCATALLYLDDSVSSCHLALLTLVVFPLLIQWAPSAFEGESTIAIHLLTAEDSTVSHSLHSNEFWVSVIYSPFTVKRSLSGET